MQHLGGEPRQPSPPRCCDITNERFDYPRPNSFPSFCHRLPVSCPMGIRLWPALPPVPSARRDPIHASAKLPNGPVAQARPIPQRQSHPPWPGPAQHVSFGHSESTDAKSLTTRRRLSLLIRRPCTTCPSYSTSDIDTAMRVVTVPAIPIGIEVCGKDGMRSNTRRTHSEISRISA